MDDLRIVPVEVEMIGELRTLAIQTFREAFAAANSEEHMQDYCNEKLSLEQVTQEYRNPESAFFFAQLKGTTIGYLKINWGSAQTERLEEQTLEIERIYVLDNFQGKQIGQHLLAHALSIAEQQQAEFVWLGVWEENVGAIRFYKKHGFEPFGTHSFMLGSDEQTDLLMRRKIKTDTLESAGR